jgi:hypothetical protein
MTTWQWIKAWARGPSDDFADLAIDAVNVADRVTLKASLLRRERDALRKALAGLVAMHRGGPNGVGNWDAAFEEAERALAIERERETVR